MPAIETLTVCISPNTTIINTFHLIYFMNSYLFIYGDVGLPELKCKLLHLLHIIQEQLRTDKLDEILLSSLSNGSSGRQTFKWISNFSNNSHFLVLKVAMNGLD